jgi:superfamily II DNA/RNA helicase
MAGYAIKNIDMDKFSESLREICPKFNVKALTEFQHNALINFIQGKDVFVNMPTGSGKYLLQNIYE